MIKLEIEDYCQNCPKFEAEVENPANIEIDDTLQMKIMLENKDRELQKLKQSKNAAKGAILAGYVTVIPPAFQKIINKLIKEVK